MKNTKFVVKVNRGGTRAVLAPPSCRVFGDDRRRLHRGPAGHRLAPRSN
jgi:hypothetical protein